MHRFGRWKWGETQTETIQTRTHTYTWGNAHFPFLLPSLFSSLFLSPSWSQPALPPNSCTDRPSRIAAPQRPSVTFSAFGSISPVIIGCPFHCASTTMAAVSLPAGRHPQKSIRKGLFLAVLMECMVFLDHFLD